MWARLGDRWSIFTLPPPAHVLKILSQPGDVMAVLAAKLLASKGAGSAARAAVVVAAAAST